MKKTINTTSFYKTLLLLILIVSTGLVNAQNINNPNKTGPLGTQVNTLSGNLYIDRTDILIPARGFNLDISFAYNSYNFQQDIGFGKGWSSAYSIGYSIDSNAARVIVWGDGREDVYDSLSNNNYKTPLGFFTKLEEYQPQKYRLTELDGTLYFFDDASHKKVTRMEEPNGNFINFTYTNKQLTNLQNQDGQAINFAYNNNRLSKITDANASPTREYNYVYDAAGNLKEAIDPLSQKFTYTYLVNGPMKTLSDKNNNLVNIIYYSDYSISEIVGCNKRISFSYDVVSNKTVVTDYVASGNQITTYQFKTEAGISWLESMSGNCCGYNVSYDYDDFGNKIKATDANGNVTEFTYDAKGNPLTVKNALGEITTYTYESAFNNITSVKDAKGFVTNLTYDAKGNLTQMKTPGNQTYLAAYNAKGDIISSTDPKGNIFNYNYDALGNPTTVTGPENYNATLSFDARGNLLAYTDARGNNTTVQYDILDRLKKITDPLNQNIQLTYDANGNETTIKNENNETTFLNYDASDRMVKIKDPMGNEATMAYDAMNNLKVLKNALGNELKLSYDTRNRLTATTDSENNSSNFSYDGHGNLTNATLKNGRELTYTYDNLNRLKNIADQTGTLASLAYDANGNINSFKNATGATTTAVYDSLNRVKQVTDPLGNSYSYTYDKNNNISSVKDRNDHTSFYTYDNINRVKTFTDNNGFVITIIYDVEGNIATLVDQNSNATNYTYDNLNRRKKMTYPDGGYTENFYDNKGNITSMRRTDGSTVNYVYDILNRLTQKTLPDGQVFNYSYDALGRVLTATNNAGAVTFTYDNLNRVTSETFDGRTIAYSYNIAGRTQTTTYPDGSVVKQEFDSRNRITKVLKNETTLAEYGYNNANQQISKTFGNGVVSNMQYDFANRLTNISTRNGSIQNTSFEYDKENNKTKIIRNNNPALSEQFTYDNGYRLTNYKRGVIGGTITQNNNYAYDAVGNRLSTNINGSSSAYNINNLNQISSISGAQNIAFTYDSRGNTTYDGTFHKKYDSENRLIKDSASPANVIAYTYDAINRRVIKSLNGIALKYTYSGLAQIEERSAANILLNSTVFTNFLSPVANDKNGGRFFYHANELNSVEAISNTNGNITELYRYDAFGKQNRFDSAGNLMTASIAGNRFGFTGQEYDSATASNRFFFRNYSPATGVFAQRDLIEYQDGMGMYQYVGNNPANGVDILGLEIINYPLPNSGPVPTSESGDAEMKLLNDLTSNTGTVVDLFNKVDVISDGVNSGFGNLSPLTGALDLQLKLNANCDIQANENSTYQEKVDGNWSVVGSSGSFVSGTGITAAALFSITVGPAVLATGTALGVYGLGDAVVEGVTGKSIGVHASDHNVYLKNKEGFEQWAKDYKVDAEIFDYAQSRPGFLQESSQYQFIKNLWMNDKGPTYLKWRRNKMIGRQKCPPEKGTRKKPKYIYDYTTKTWILASYDPNEIIGPDGVPGKKWVSVHDQLPYTILFENDSTASAPARIVRITKPIEAKEDPSTLQLGSFGFNNQTFDIPQGRAAYYQRLDCRDSMGLFVDLVAGFDQINNIVFWEFQTIDPITLLPPEDPYKGFLFLQDSVESNYGHGFVNYSIKPRQNAVTLDTIAAKAEIVFDSNELIPTNVHTNTIDAVAPQNQLLTATTGSDFKVNLTWSGQDDTNGSGIDYYTIYVTTDEVNYTVFKDKIKRTDTTFSLPPFANYCFFILATDRVGNTEELRPNQNQCVFVGGVVPVTWLYFNGKNEGTDNILNWATATEQNSSRFEIERSLTGNNFSKIGSVAAAGNSPTARSYSYTDNKIDRLNSSVFYYRLKQIDNNNQFSYSNIVRLNYNVKAVEKTIVYPNPTSGQVMITLGSEKLIGTWLSVYDEAGKLVSKLKIKAQNQPVDLSQFVNGIYLIKLQNNEVLRIIKQK